MIELIEIRDVDVNEVESGKMKNKTAKKDFVIHHNDFHLEIKKGDNLKQVPDRFYQNLKTEKVI